jgi:hypothetical protein
MLCYVCTTSGTGLNGVELRQGLHRAVESFTKMAGCIPKTHPDDDDHGNGERYTLIECIPLTKVAGLERLLVRLLHGDGMKNFRHGMQTARRRLFSYSLLPLSHGDN